MQTKEQTNIRLADNLFHQHLVVAEVRDTGTPVFFGCPHDEQTCITRFAVDVAVHHAFFAPAVHMRRGFLLQEAHASVAELLVFGL